MTQSRRSQSDFFSTEALHVVWEMQSVFSCSGHPQWNAVGLGMTSEQSTGPSGDGKVRKEDGETCV